MSKDQVRIEIRLKEDSRQLKDVEKAAISIDVEKPEAIKHLIIMWSRVLHGELSPGAFWELYGVQTTPQHTIMQPPIRGAMPITTREVSQPQTTIPSVKVIQEDSEEVIEREAAAMAAAFRDEDDEEHQEIETLRRDPEREERNAAEALNYWT